MAILVVLATGVLLLPLAQPGGCAIGRLTVMVTRAHGYFCLTTTPLFGVSYGFFAYPNELSREVFPAIVRYKGDALFVSISRTGEAFIRIDRTLTFALLSAYPAVAGARFLYRRGRRVGRGDARRCLHCGYDLWGNVTGKCPECGTPTVPETPA